MLVVKKITNTLSVFPPGLLSCPFVFPGSFFDLDLMPPISFS